MDTEELEARLNTYSQGLQEQGRGESSPSLSGRAMDGKTVRGVGAHGRSVHLLSVATHQGTVLAQVEVGQHTNEIGAAPALLERLDLRGTVVTADAMLAQRELARQILEQGGDYLMVIKEHQPGMYEAISELFEVGEWMQCELGTRYW